MRESDRKLTSAATLQEEAVERAQPELQDSQQSGLHAAAEALNRLVEQDAMQHTQTRALMGRILAPPVPQEEMGRGVTGVHLRTADSMSMVNWTPEGDMMIPLYEALETRSPRWSSPTPRQRPY